MQFRFKASSNSKDMLFKWKYFTVCVIAFSYLDWPHLGSLIFTVNKKILKLILKLFLNSCLISKMFAFFKVESEEKKKGLLV